MKAYFSHAMNECLDVDIELQLSDIKKMMLNQVGADSDFSMDELKFSVVTINGVQFAKLAGNTSKLLSMIKESGNKPTTQGQCYEQAQHSQNLVGSIIKQLKVKLTNQSSLTPMWLDVNAAVLFAGQQHDDLERQILALNPSHVYPIVPSGPEKIQRIKLIRSVYGYGLKEAKELSEGVTPHPLSDGLLSGWTAWPAKLVSETTGPLPHDQYLVLPSVMPVKGDGGTSQKLCKEYYKFCNVVPDEGRYFGGDVAFLVL